MIFIFIALMIIYISRISLNFKKFNKDYLSIDSTTIINGIFVLIVFISHFYNYNCYSYYLKYANNFDLPVLKVITRLGQLMVVTFLFYSGYGIFERIKKDRKKYIDSFFKKRFLKLFLNFSIAVTAFLIMDLLIGKHYKISKILLSYIGLESLGNSNWYIFVTFILYLAIIAVFKIFKKERTCLIAFTLISIAYIYILSIFKSNYWCNTLICFSAGMWYSYFKERIEKVVFKNHLRYFVTLISALLLFAVLYKFRTDIYVHSVYSIIFVLIIVLISAVVTTKSKILLFLGHNVFGIYIFQMIPIILLQNKMNIYLYLTLSFVITILIAVLFKYLTDKLWKRINN